MKGICIIILLPGKKMKHIIPEVQYESAIISIESMIRIAIENAFKPETPWFCFVEKKIIFLFGQEVGEWFFFDGDEEINRRCKEIEEAHARNEKA